MTLEAAIEASHNLAYLGNGSPNSKRTWASKHQDLHASHHLLTKIRHSIDQAPWAQNRQVVFTVNS